MFGKFSMSFYNPFSCNGAADESIEFKQHNTLAARTIIFFEKQIK